MDQTVVRYTIETGYKPKRKLIYRNFQNIENLSQLEEKLKGKEPKELEEIENMIDSPAMIFFKGKKKDHYAVGVEVAAKDGNLQPKGYEEPLELNGSRIMQIEFLFEKEDNIENLYRYAKTYIKQQNLLEKNGYQEILDREYEMIYFSENRKTLSFRFFVENIEKKRITDEEEIELHTKQELYRLAYFDFLTGQHNWNWLWDKLDKCKEEGIDEYAFVHFDVKGFKSINEIYGSEIGNATLRMICRAMNLQDWIYYSARCDNDNFAIIAKPLPKEQLCQKLNTMFQMAGTLEKDKSFRVFYRCGVVYMKAGDKNAVHVADLAKMAQKLGKKYNMTEIFFYTEELRQENEKSKQVKKDFVRAVKEDEFVVYFQPKIEVETEQIVGAEALVRWNYKHETMRYPDSFIPYMENNGMMGQLDGIVLDKVCQKLSEWKEKNLLLLPISVNLSHTQLYKYNLVDTIIKTVKKWKVDFSLIEFELTENAIYKDWEYLTGIMNKLHALGFGLSMDDFGSGAGSLRFLEEIPFDTLKVDKRFFNEIGQNGKEQKDKQIIQDIIAMAKHMHINSLIEGVELYEQKEFLKQWGCRYVQGYYYSKPLPADEYEELLRKASGKLGKNTV